MGAPRSREKAGLDERGRHARHVLARGECGGGGQAHGQCEALKRAAGAGREQRRARHGIGGWRGGPYRGSEAEKKVPSSIPR